MDKKEENSKPHFVKVIDYNNQPWLTDIILGQRNVDTHAHVTLSGAGFWYLRDEQGNEIIKNGEVINQRFQ